MKIGFSRSADRDIRKLNEPLKSHILDAIFALPDGDVKRLETNMKPPMFRLRIGDMRAIFFRADKDVIVIDGVASRGEIYRRLRRK